MRLLEELATMLRDANKARIWGQIQIDLQDGRPVVLRETVTRKLTSEDNREHPARH